MRTSYKCRAYPDPEQASVLNRTFGCVRVVWNRTLAWRHQRYYGEQVKTNFSQANAWLAGWCVREWRQVQAGRRARWMKPMPEDWDRAVAVVAHPDDLEYGVASAVAR